MAFSKEAMDNGILIARIERIERELRDARLHGLKPDEEYAERLRLCLSRLPRLGAPSELLLAIPNADLEEAKACTTIAAAAFLGLDHRERATEKLQTALKNHDNVILVGPAEETADVVTGLKEGPLPERVAKVVYVDASGPTVAEHGAYEVLRRAGEALGVTDVELGDYAGLWYQSVLNAIEGEYPHPPFGALRSENPATYVIVQNCDPKLAGFICCNLRDSLWQLPIKWVWTTEKAGAPMILRMPGDFFNQQVNLDTGFDSGPQYRRAQPPVTE